MQEGDQSCRHSYLPMGLDAVHHPVKIVFVFKVSSQQESSSTRVPERWLVSDEMQPIAGDGCNIFFLSHYYL